MRPLLAGIAFLTRLPVGRCMAFDAEDVSRSVGWFPLVGLLVGSLCGLMAWLLRPHLPSITVAVLLVAVDALLTGALHLDGLADSADGFGGGRESEDVLRIMRDHSIGSYGAVALILAIALKVSAYGFLLARADWFYAVALTPALGRWSIVLLTGTLAYARQSPSVIQTTRRSATAWGTGAMLVALGVARFVPAWIAAAAVLMVTAAFGLYCRRRIGGITGDTLGANVQLAESAALLAMLWNGRP